MFDGVLKEKLKPFLDETTNNALEWFKRLPWVAQVALILAATIILGTWQFHDVVSRWASLDKRLARVIIHREVMPPISEDIRTALRRSVENKLEQLNARMDQDGDFAGQAWTTAEYVLALAGRRS